MTTALVSHLQFHPAPALTGLPPAIANPTALTLCGQLRLSSLESPVYTPGDVRCDSPGSLLSSSPSCLHHRFLHEKRCTCVHHGGRSVATHKASGTCTETFVPPFDYSPCGFSHLYSRHSGQVSIITQLRNQQWLHAIDLAMSNSCPSTIWFWPTISTCFSL